MRRRMAVIGATLVAALLASCTLLVPFDPIASTDATISADASGRDAYAFDLLHVCELDGAPIANGYYCGGHNTNSYPGPTTDLLACIDASVAQITHCSEGCIYFPPGFPDECNDCLGKASANYCGRDFDLWDAGSSPISNALIGCRDGQKTGDALCAGDGGCVSGKEAGAPAIACAGAVAL